MAILKEKIQKQRRGKEDGRERVYEREQGGRK